MFIYCYIIPILLCIIYYGIHISLCIICIYIHVYICMICVIFIYKNSLSEGIQTCNMKNRDFYWRRYRIQETLYTGQWCLIPLQSRHLGTSHSSPNYPIIFSWISSKVWDVFPFQRWFSFKKLQGTKSAPLSVYSQECFSKSEMKQQKLLFDRRK